MLSDVGLGWGSLRNKHQEFPLLPISETGTGVASEAYVVFPALAPYGSRRYFCRASDENLFLKTFGGTGGGQGWGDKVRGWGVKNE